LKLDWKAIRPLNGSQADGFEELCAQLARAVNPPGATFKRKGAPDAGVECYSIPDGWERVGLASQVFRRSWRPSVVPA